jgi:hypothetical protein
MPRRSNFANQVRIALIVAQSLLKKSSASGEMPLEEAESIQTEISSLLVRVKPYANKTEDDA